MEKKITTNVYADNTYRLKESRNAFRKLAPEKKNRDEIIPL